MSCNDHASFAQSSQKHNSSEIFWRDDRMAIAHIDSWKHATKTIKQRATTRLRKRPENNSPRVPSHTRLRQFRAILWQTIPQSFFVRAQCFLNGGYCSICSRSQAIRNQEKVFLAETPFAKTPFSGKLKVSTSTVAALFSKMALTGQRIAMVDMLWLVFPAFPYLP